VGSVSSNRRRLISSRHHSQGRAGPPATPSRSGHPPLEQLADGQAWCGPSSDSTDCEVRRRLTTTQCCILGSPRNARGRCTVRPETGPTPTPIRNPKTPGLRSPGDPRPPALTTGDAGSSRRRAGDPRFGGVARILPVSEGIQATIWCARRDSNPQFSQPLTSRSTCPMSRTFQLGYGRSCLRPGVEDPWNRCHHPAANVQQPAGLKPKPTAWDRIPVLRIAGVPAVHGQRQGSAQRRHGGGLSSSDASTETIAGEKLDIVEVRD
jgi:hypothetical protein